jgi:FixJ family two-component response regulator
VSKPAAVIHLVDDDESIRKALTRLLKAEGFVVQAYANGGELRPFRCRVLVA